MVGLGDCAFFLTHLDIYLRVAKEGGGDLLFPFTPVFLPVFLHDLPEGC